MTNERLLYILKRNSAFISGEDISHQLGISRTAIWKHINELRELGYDITAVPHLGYRLLSCPDRLYPWEIKYLQKNKLVGKVIYYYENLSSTMGEAMDLALKGAEEGTVVVAEGQTKGKGRMGRAWLSPKYKGIYFSLIIKPDLPLKQAPVLTLISAVAICEGIKQKLNLETQIKWPNDILLGDKKIAGILTELSAEMDMVHAIIVGVGINVNNDRKTLPYPASCLKEIAGSKINRIDLLKNILFCFEERYLEFKRKGIQGILDKWCHLNATLGRRVRLSLSTQKNELIGEAVNIDSDGSLLIRQDSGLIERVISGDIIHCKQ